MMAAPLPEADRRRLLEIRGLHPAVPVVVLHPLLTVVTGFGRDASDTVVESLGRLGAPLGPAVTGTVEIGGRIRDLPEALAQPGDRPLVVRGPMIVGAIGRRRASAAAADLSKRAARVSRREAGLARRDQLVDRLEQLSNRADEIETELTQAHVVDDSEIERLLAAVRAPQPISTNPIMTALIDEWDALVVERKASSGGPTVDRAEANLDAIRERIAQRDSATSETDPTKLDPAAVVRVQEAHAALERLASDLDGARRGERRAAGQRVTDALDAERQALGAIGFESYPSFLLAMAEGRGQDDASHDEAALVTAEAALARARDREQVFVLLSERELDLRARVARLLGRLPGPDVGAELRESAAPDAESTAAQDRLDSSLRAAGVPVGDDPVAAADRHLERAPGRRARSSALRAELEEIESEGGRLDEQLDQAESDLAAAERDLIESVSGALAGREAPVTLAAADPQELLDAMKELVEPSGPPVVVGECFDEMSPMGRAAVLNSLSDVSRRRQVVIVTEVPAVAAWAADLGIDGVVWTPVEADAAPRRTRDAAPAVAEPAVAEPAAVAEPVVAEPVVAEPAVVEPTIVEPVVVEPVPRPVEAAPMPPVVEPIAPAPRPEPVVPAPRPEPAPVVRAPDPEPVVRAPEPVPEPEAEPEPEPAAAVGPVPPLAGSATHDEPAETDLPTFARGQSNLRFGWDPPAPDADAPVTEEPAAAIFSGDTEALETARRLAQEPVPDFFESRIEAEPPAAEEPEAPAPAARESVTPAPERRPWSPPPAPAREARPTMVGRPPRVDRAAPDRPKIVEPPVPAAKVEPIEAVPVEPVTPVPVQPVERVEPPEAVVVEPVAPAPVEPVAPAPVETVERSEPVEAIAVDAVPVEAAPVEAPAPSFTDATDVAPKRNPLDDLFVDRGDEPATTRPEKAKKPPKAKREREPRPEREARPERQPEHRAAPPAKSRRGRRKHKPEPPPMPWDGRFETTAREAPTSIQPAAPLPEGSAPLAVCVRHPGVVTRQRCVRCGEPACDECLVTPRGRRSSMCIECAILEAGVRSRRRLRG
jgi:hypothetical protein